MAVVRSAYKKVQAHVCLSLLAINCTDLLLYSV